MPNKTLVFRSECKGISLNKGGKTMSANFEAKKVVVEEIKEKIQNENVEAILHSSSTGFKMDKDSIMIRSLVNAYAEVTKDYESKPICSAGGTYAREFSNCVAFGPEMEGYGEIIIHQPNERMQIRAIEDIMKIYYKAFADLIEKVSFKK